MISPEPPGSERAIIVRDATPSDAAYVCARLAETFTNATAAERRVHFAVPWQVESGQEDYGVVAEADGRIVGYGGWFPSERVIDGRRVQYRNYSSWWIDPAYRGAGIGRKIVEMGLRTRAHCVITMLTLPETMLGFWRKHPLAPFEASRRLHLFPALRAIGWRRRVRVLPPGEIPTELSDDHRRVLRDHLDLRCQVVVVEKDGAYCAFITRRRTVTVAREHWSAAAAACARWVRPAAAHGTIGMARDRAADLLAGIIPAAELFFVSDPTFLRRYFCDLAAMLASRQRSVALLLDNERIGLPASVGVPVPSEYYVLQPSPLVDRDVDALYSEFFVLPIGQESR